MLTNEQKQQHVSVCQELLDEVDQNFLLRVTTEDETVQ
jgi:hypothetical protein